MLNMNEIRLESLRGEYSRVGNYWAYIDTRDGILRRCRVGEEKRLEAWEEVPAPRAANWN